MPRGEGSPGRVRRFVQQYLVDRNGSAAAIRAGYAPRGAKSRAYELMQREDVKQAIDEADAIERQRCTSDRDRHLREVAKIAYASVASFCKVVGKRVRLISFAELAAMDLAAVQSVRVDQRGRIELKLHDKSKALELYARLRGWLDEPAEKPTARPRSRITVPELKTA